MLIVIKIFYKKLSLEAKNAIMKKLHFLFLLLTATLLNGCGIYNFTGTGQIDSKNFQVNYFQNNADLIEPGIERTFTLALQEIILNQTNLSLTNSNGDLFYDGEITSYRIAPMTATADQRAAQNRLTIAVNVRFVNKKKESDNFQKSFSFYYDYPATSQLVGSTLATALDEIFTRITQDIFNESLAKW
ncbi:MAG: outer membrane lipopolysaccharide assembly protein LptE/RlpB [Flavobacterium sp.]